MFEFKMFAVLDCMSKALNYLQNLVSLNSPIVMFINTLIYTNKGLISIDNTIFINY